MDGKSASGNAKLGDFLDGMKGRASNVAAQRLRESLKKPTPELRNWLADVESYAREKWELHHLPAWRELSQLICEFEEQGLLTEEQIGALDYFLPANVLERMGSPGPIPPVLSEIEEARLAKKAFERLRVMLPQQADRIDAAVQKTFEYRYHDMMRPYLRPREDSAER
jgi:hypothetical protein